MSDESKRKSIRNFSDTARWVAVYRAMETERPDALFRDPYAHKLAGERGEEIVKSLRGGKQQAWSMIVRTTLIDDILMRILAGSSIDVVMNLAAGLDARPYRLAPPAGAALDRSGFAGMIEYKNEMLADETPKCRLECIAMDLADVRARRQFFGQVNTSAQNIFVITEGLLAYLNEEQVSEIAKDLHECGNFQYWVTDIASPKVKQMMEKRWGKQLKAAGRRFSLLRKPEKNFSGRMVGQAPNFTGF